LVKPRSIPVKHAHSKKVRLAPGDAAISAMLSAEGEAVELARPVAVGDGVEGWLAGLTEVGWRLQPAEPDC
jgi:hypothetical protein